MPRAGDWVQAMLVIGHRGAAGLAPENTFASFDAALSVGVDGIETDVRITRDGVLVLMHDPSLARTTDGRGRVAAKDWGSLSRLDAGSWFAPRFSGGRIPRVEDFLDQYLGRVSLCLEVKTSAAAAPLARLLEERGLGARQDLEVISFSWEVTREIRRRMPQLRVGQLVPRVGRPTISRVARSGADRLWAPTLSLPPTVVAQAHRAGLSVIAWSVLSRGHVPLMGKSGVDGVVLDDPGWALDLS